MTPPQPQQQPPQDPLEIEVDGSHIGLWLAMHAADLEYDETHGITGPYFQSRVTFHRQLFEFVNTAEPRVERYRLVKVVPVTSDRQGN